MIGTDQRNARQGNVGIELDVSGPAVLFCLHTSLAGMSASSSRWWEAHTRWYPSAMIRLPPASCPIAEARTRSTGDNRFPCFALARSFATWTFSGECGEPAGPKDVFRLPVDQLGRFQFRDDLARQELGHHEGEIIESGRIVVFVGFRFPMFAHRCAFILGFDARLIAAAAGNWVCRACSRCRRHRVARASAEDLARSPRRICEGSRTGRRNDHANPGRRSPWPCSPAASHWC